ncbi:hypothetical protein SAMN04489864_10933 [Pedobacter insulae]|uniref:TerB family tellurite resistance protein n=2 Tax=Pedobacter insulae TaxID=414048 RepID=A0A1I2Z6Y1_9SPHI|nr:hypothetical protein SAMN04489864_10933 [Pedobacter insulae]
MGLSRKLCRVVMLVALSLWAFSGSAQTWGEIFNQKKTQKKYLLQQIAALQIYIGYAKKGYDIVGGGIHTVKDITNGEFSLHRNFFASLAAVNPAIKNSAAVAEIINGGLGIISVLKSWKASELNANDWGYVSLVKANLLAECASDLEQLFLVITSGKLEMKDDERLGRLEKLRLSMQDKYDFALSFSTDLQMLIRQKNREQESINQIRRWYEIE